MKKNKPSILLAQGGSQRPLPQRLTAPLWPQRPLRAPVPAGAGSQVRAPGQPRSGRSSMWFSFAKAERPHCSRRGPQEGPALGNQGTRCEAVSSGALGSPANKMMHSFSSAWPPAATALLRTARTTSVP